jgi:uncharacterized membrane protein (UPF0127 family)
MSESVSHGYALNCTRRQYLATRLAVADGHWSRLRGLIGKRPGDFRDGRGLWITPCRGVHTWGMRFPIDVVYLTRDLVVLHLEESLSPWRFAPVRLQAASVLELPEHTLRATGTTIGDELEINTRSPGDVQPA